MLQTCFITQQAQKPFQQSTPKATFTQHHSKAFVQRQTAHSYSHAYLSATETLKWIDYMKKAGKMLVIVVQHTDPEKMKFEGYCVWRKIGDIVTSGPLVDKVKAQLSKLVVDAFPPKAVVTLRPVKYKIQGTVADAGKTLIL